VGEDTDIRTPIEREIARSFVDDSGHGKPLSRRARTTKRTVESYLQAGVLPRYMDRLREIDEGVRSQLRLVERSYRAVREACGGDAELFARRWRTRAEGFRFEPLNELIREHNEWYPMEARLPLDPRTGDYVRRAGRPYTREELDVAWVLERFPPEP